MTYQTVKSCFFATFCLCDPRGIMIRAFVTQLQASLRRLLVKDSRPRRLYDRGGLLLRLRSLAQEDGPFHWFHVSYGNLTSGRYTLMLLASEIDTLRARLVHPLIPLVVRDDLPDLGCVNLWVAAKDFDMSQAWQLQAYKLHSSPLRIVGHFNPGRHILAEALDSPDACDIFWHGPPAPRARRRQGGGPRRPAGPRDGGDLLALEDAPPAPVADALPLEDEFGGDDGDLPDDLVAALQDIDGWFGPDDQLQRPDGEQARESWDPVYDNSDGGDDASAPSAGAQAQAVPLGGAPPAFAQPAPLVAMPGVAEAEALAEAAPVPPPPEPVAERPARAPRGPRGGAARAPHLEFDVDVRGDGLCVFKYDTQLNILAAHCRLPAHGRDCRVNRTLEEGKTAAAAARGRPLGFLVAWLRCAEQFATQQEHHDISKLKIARSSPPLVFCPKGRGSPVV